MRHSFRLAWKGYAIALTAVAVAAALRAALYRATGGGLPFLTFFPAVIVAGLYGGLGPGLLAVVLSAVGASFWILPSDRPGGVWPGDLRAGDWIAEALFVLVSLFIVALCETVRRSRRRADEALAANARLATIVESSDDAIVSKAVDGTIQSWNPAATRLLGYTPDEVVGKPIYTLVPQDRRAEENEILDRLRHGERVDHYETVRLRKDGNPVEVSITVSPLRDPLGRVVGASTIIRDITARRLAETALRQSEARHAAALYAALDCVVSMDHAGNVIEWNPAAERTFGYARDEALGREMASLIIPQHLREAHRTALARYLATGQGTVLGKRLQLVGVRRGGSEFPVELAITRLPTSGPPTFTAYLRDISDRRAAEDALRGAMEQAERASRMKDEFLANLSHELRTPLNAILGWAQILSRKGSRDEEDWLEGLRTIERNARAQTRIIDDLLDVSRIVSGKVRLDVQRVDLAAVVRAAVETMEPAADAKGIRLQAVLDPRAGPLSGDPSRLQQVFWNLFSNAIKFTPKGGRVQVRLERIDSHVEVSVTDTGEGIRPEFLPHLFERFRQADASTTRRHGGLGLGLSIVKQLVELHGGSVRAKSPGEGQGATFTVSLPLTVVHPDPALDTERRHPHSEDLSGLIPAECADVAGVRVLVVDDEPDARTLVRRVLEDCDAVLNTAGSAAEAFELVQSWRPDVLVADIGMPGEDGYSLIRRVRALGPERGGKVPAVALTAYARSEDRTRSVLAGYQMHVAKPVEPAELITMVASLAGRTGTR